MVCTSIHLVTLDCKDAVESSHFRLTSQVEADYVKTIIEQGQDILIEVYGCQRF